MAATRTRKTATAEPSSRESLFTLYSFDGHTYARLGELTNRGRQAAAREWVDRHPEDKDKTFLVVPSRYTKLVRVTPKVTTTFSTEEVDHESVAEEPREDPAPEGDPAED